MAVSSYTVDEGLLSLGGVGVAIDCTAQVESCKVAFGKDQEDSRKTLSGDTLGGAVEYPATLEVKFIQDDLAANGLVAWTHTNRGTEQPFTFTPSNALGRAISGVVVVDPLDIGGDVGAKGPTSDAKWACVGFPELGADLS